MAEKWEFANTRIRGLELRRRLLQEKVSLLSIKLNECWNSDSFRLFSSIHIHSIETANLQVFGGFYNTATYASINIKVSILLVLLSRVFI